MLAETSYIVQLDFAMSWAAISLAMRVFKDGMALKIGVWWEITILVCHIAVTDCRPDMPFVVRPQFRVCNHEICMSQIGTWTLHIPALLS